MGLKKENEKGKKKRKKGQGAQEGTAVDRGGHGGSGRL